MKKLDCIQRIRRESEGGEKVRTKTHTVALTPQTFSGMSAGDDIRLRMIMTATNTGSVKLGPVHFYYKN